ncbi:hypothetical protein SJAV_11080 [Sulfurisphaera javensis]|uniref:Uncharacterized protein n=1 Tax=Sulfurisphaera javensis TaxID=2049879 RepID=A0AAT9GR49_9CREN
MKSSRLVFLFILLLPFLSVTLITHSEFSVGTFFAYNQTVIMLLPNGTTTTLHEVILQKVDKIFSNGTMEINVTVYNVAEKYYLPPTISLNNISFPINFYYIPPSLLGEQCIHRGGAPLRFINYSNGIYLYNDNYTLEGVKIVFNMWVNKDGIAVKVQTLQIGVNKVLVSNATAILWKTNYYNTSVTPPTFKGYTEAKVVTMNINDLPIVTAEKLMKYIIITGVLAIVLILLFRK